MDIIKLLLDGIMDILEGTSGESYAVNDERFKRAKKISLTTGIVMVSCAIIAFLIWMISRII